VAAAGTGASAFKAIPCDDARMESDDILLLILSRAESARQGIRMVGELMAQYGLRPSGMEGCESMSTFAVADSREGWWLEVAPGNHWIAVRVPDDEVGVRENAFAIHDADLTDEENVMASPGLAEYAREQGWWNGDIHHFDFAEAYGSPVSCNEWGPELDKMNMRRRWRAMNLLSGQETAEDALLYSVVPNRLLTEEDLKAVLRDVYEETSYDLRKTPAAGRYGNPFHDDPADYSLCRSWTVASFVADLREDAPSVMWVCLGCPKTGVYVPVYTDINTLPACCEEADAEKESLFRRFQELHYLTCRRYSENLPLVEGVRAAFEREAAEELAAADAALTARSPQERREGQTEFSAGQVRRALEVCRKTKSALLNRY
jgi:dipeptidase